MKENFLVVESNHTQGGLKVSSISHVLCSSALAGSLSSHIPKPSSAFTTSSPSFPHVSSSSTFFFSEIQVAKCKLLQLPVLPTAFLPALQSEEGAVSCLQGCTECQEGPQSSVRPHWLECLGPGPLLPTAFLFKLSSVLASETTFFLKFIFYLFYWSIVDLQCSVNFCCTAVWLSYMYIYRVG